MNDISEDSSNPKRHRNVIFIYYVRSFKWIFAKTCKRTQMFCYYEPYFWLYLCSLKAESMNSTGSCHSAQLAVGRGRCTGQKRITRAPLLQNMAHAILNDGFVVLLYLAYLPSGCGKSWEEAFITLEASARLQDRLDKQPALTKVQRGEE